MRRVGALIQHFLHFYTFQVQIFYKFLKYLHLVVVLRKFNYLFQFLNNLNDFFYHHLTR